MNPRRPAPEDLKSQGQNKTANSYLRIDYFSVKDDFSKWLKIQGINWEHHAKKMLRYLERFSKPICKPMDLVLMLEGLGNSQKRHLTNALRKLFNFYEAQDLAPKGYLDKLRANFPKYSIGIDLKVPDETQVIESYKRMRLVKDRRYFALYNLLLDSGLRLIEGVYLYNQILRGEIQIENHGDFSVIPLGYFRGTKLAYFGFITESTLQLIRPKSKPINYKKVIGTSKLGALSWKYLRKFANDIMTSEKINIPESVSDFIEGRVPRSIGARHYMQLKRKAVAFYPRYSKFITNLRKKASVSL